MPWDKAAVRSNCKFGVGSLCVKLCTFHAVVGLMCMVSRPEENIETALIKLGGFVVPLNLRSICMVIGILTSSYTVYFHLNTFLYFTVHR